MPSQNYFDAQERKGYNYLLQYNKVYQWFTDFTLPESKFSYYDAIGIGTKSGDPYLLEYKCRNHDSTKFTTAIIDEDKYLNLVTSQTRPYYLNFFNDGRLLVWDLWEIHWGGLFTFEQGKMIYDIGKGRNTFGNKIHLPKIHAKQFVLNASYPSSPFNP